MFVEIDIFSGRPNPRWELSEADNAWLTRLLESLEGVAGRASPSPPGLGYRGFRLRDAAGMTWSAYGGLVQSPDGLVADPNRRIERFLLDHMPANYEDLRSSIESELGQAPPPAADFR
jgi:hypothetical protein